MVDKKVGIVIKRPMDCPQKDVLCLIEKTRSGHTHEKAERWLWMLHMKYNVKGQRYAAFCASAVVLG